MQKKVAGFGATYWQHISPLHMPQRTDRRLHTKRAAEELSRQPKNEVRVVLFYDTLLRAHSRERCLVRVFMGSWSADYRDGVFWYMFWRNS